MLVSEIKSKGGKILVIDDDKMHRRLFELIATQLGHDVRCEGSCEKALAALQAEQYHLVLMDYRLPVMDGCECTRQIRALNSPHSAVPIIAVTASVYDSIRHECFESGMNDFLGKPFTMAELKQKIDTWL